MLFLCLVSYSSQTDGLTMRKRCSHVTASDWPYGLLCSPSFWPLSSRDHSHVFVWFDSVSDQRDDDNAVRLL